MATITDTRGTSSETRETGLAAFFEFARYGVTARGEMLAGLTTFLVMMYIAFVNPGILTSVPDSAGTTLNFGATVTATCWVAALMSIWMGLYAKRPFAMAPGMGLNAVVTFGLVATQQLTWGAAFGLIMIEGLAVSLLMFTGFRTAVLTAVPDALKHAIAAGIGLFLLYIGLNEAGIVAGNPVYASDPSVPPVALGNFATPTLLVSLFTLSLTIVLQVMKNRYALLIGIIVGTIFATVLNYASMELTGTAIYTAPTQAAWARIPDSFAQVPAMPGFYLFNIFDAFSQQNFMTAVSNAFGIMLSDLFDTLGTFIGVAALAGFLVKNSKGQDELPDVEKPLRVDSAGPIFGGMFGASSATSYIESGAGVQSGGRTGLVAVTVGVLFLIVPFFTPLIAVVPMQATAPALILVGFFMMKGLTGFDWGDFRVGLPVLLTMVLMPLTYSITNGIGAGFILWTLIFAFSKKEEERPHPLMWVVSGMFLLYFLSQAFHVWFGI